MPSEPESKMDELLRTYARKRREDAGEPPELHAATRRLLQAEVAKLRPRESGPRRTGWAWLLAHWPRVAFAAGVTAVLAVTLWNVLPERKGSPALFAKQDAAETATTPGADKRADPAQTDQSGAIAEQEGRTPQPAPTRALDAFDEAKRRGLSTDTKAMTLEKQVELQTADAGAKDYFRAPAPPRPAPSSMAQSDRVTVGASLALAPAAPQTNPGTAAVFYSELAGGSRPGDQQSVAKDFGAITSTSLAFEAGRGGVDSSVGARPRGRFADGSALAPGRNEATVAGGAPASRSLTLATKPLTDDAMLKSKALLARQETVRAASPVALAPPAAPAPFTAVVTPAPALAPLDGLAVAQPTGTMRYRLLRRTETEETIATRKEQSFAGVLSSFDFEQDGDRVRVIDHDGSVYAGRLLTPAEAGEARFWEFAGEEPPVSGKSADRRKAVLFDDAKQSPARAAASRPAAGVAFRVTGTSRASGQAITLEATLAGDGEASWGRQTFTKAPEAPEPPLNRPLNEPAKKNPASLKAEGALAPSDAPDARRLVGRLRIGATNEVSIIAVPAAR